MKLKKMKKKRKNDCFRRNTPSERREKNEKRKKIRASNKNVDGDYKKKS